MISIPSVVSSQQKNISSTMAVILIGKVQWSRRRLNFRVIDKAYHILLKFVWLFTNSGIKYHEHKHTFLVFKLRLVAFQQFNF
jgi:hypothetical protein